MFGQLSSGSQERGPHVGQEYCTHAVGHLDNDIRYLIHFISLLSVYLSSRDENEDNEPKPKKNINLFINNVEWQHTEPIKALDGS